MKVTFKINFNIKIVIRSVMALKLNSGFKFNLKQILKVIFALTLLSGDGVNGTDVLKNMSVMEENKAYLAKFEL